MTNLNRRTLLSSTAAMLGMALTPRTAFGQAAGPPVARIDPVTEVIFGTKITDRYRWMESKSPEWLAYTKAQGAYAAKILAAIPGRDQLADSIDHITGLVIAVESVQIAGNLIFIEKRPAGGSLENLYLRDGLAGTERILIDPTRFTAKATHYALDWWFASPDGSHVAFGISPGGNEQSVLHVMVTATGEILPEQMDRCWSANPSWLPDGSGFFYNRFHPGVSPESNAYEEYSAAWFHRLRTNPQDDIKILDAHTSPSVPMLAIDAPYVQATPGSSLAIAQIQTGDQNEVALYATSLESATAGKPLWRKICDNSAKVTGFALLGEDIYLMTHQDASRYRLLISNAAGTKQIVPQTSSVIRAISAAKDGIYIQDLNAGLGGLRRVAPDGTITQIQLPFSGGIDALYTSTLQDGAWFMLESWIHPAVICHVDAQGVVHQTDIAPKPPIDVSPYTSEETHATARDGTKIPMSLSYRKDLKRDGSAPLLAFAYGAYGITYDPWFLARYFAFLDQGGIFAVVNVRGGGELGEDWHLAGKKLTKPNTWRDLIDSCEFLIAQGYTSKPKLAIWGGSAGGITVGMFMTERPDLAAVVIDDVGVSNATRSEFGPNGAPNITEFGSIKTPDGFKGLLAMDAYQHVQDGTKYPSVMLISGLNDPRVEPWELTKMTARLQAATASTNPILLRVDTDAGHGYGSTRRQRDLETADMMAFILWRTGAAAFQPKAE